MRLPATARVLARSARLGLLNVPDAKQTLPPAWVRVHFVMATPTLTNTPARARLDLDRPWQHGDTLPAPEAVHSDGDTAWALFNELACEQERRFADTAPMTQPPLRPEEVSWAATMPASAAAIQPRLVPPAAPKAQSQVTLDAALLLARRNNRVCPRPERWTAFTALLPVRKSGRGSQRPPASATGDAWALTPPLSKRLCFREQVEWAESLGVLAQAMAFMQSMAEGEWLHMGEE